MGFGLVVRWPRPLSADPFQREEAWIASGDGDTFREFLARHTSAAERRPPLDTGVLRESGLLRNSHVVDIGAVVLYR